MIKEEKKEKSPYIPSRNTYYYFDMYIRESHYTNQFFCTVKKLI